ncbi:BON domain-containing protein [Nocardia brasiliensis]|uniref:BON domain-containing protein n=1 Tax=Nocardia brasiliensis TaxID=37326 RepID=A0A6G9XTA9_NOCBR|nr:BON domain-containing protein [Nocardia brasiliensis]QIS04149.1 BON domain-containing protein [Nocardia brasiliensis]
MEQPQYLVAHLRRALAEDPRTAELGVHVTIRGEVVALDGEVATEERKRQLETVVREQLPRARIHNDVRVMPPSAPGASEALGTVDPGGS